MKYLFSTGYKIFTALMIVVLAFAAMPVSPAYAADTGLQSPTACAGWTNPANAVSSNNVYATTIQMVVGMRWFVRSIFLPFHLGQPSMGLRSW